MKCRTAISTIGLNPQNVCARPILICGTIATLNISDPDVINIDIDVIATI